MTNSRIAPDERETCAETVLDVRGLSTQFDLRAGIARAVDDLSFAVRRGETLAIVGESGSGKSVTALSLMRLLTSPPARISAGSVRFDGTDLLTLSDAEMTDIRGHDIAMIFQEPMSSLNPVISIGEQIAEVARRHLGFDKDKAWDKALEMLRMVGIPEPDQRARAFPHQLSGGMRQRVMIAIALACNPKVVIADEPTTALDVTIQAQILQLIKVLQKEMSMGVIFITHDMGVVAEIADRVLVMYQGEAVETGTVEQIFHAPQHPYTRALLAAVPQLGAMKGLDYPRRFPLISLEHPAKQAPPSSRKRWWMANLFYECVILSPVSLCAAVC